MAKSRKARERQFPRCPLQHCSTAPLHKARLNQCLLSQTCQGKAAAHLDRRDSLKGYDLCARLTQLPVNPLLAALWDRRHLSVRAARLGTHQRSRRSPPRVPSQTLQTCRHPRLSLFHLPPSSPECSEMLTLLFMLGPESMQGRLTRTTDQYH